LREQEYIVTIDDPDQVQDLVSFTVTHLDMNEGEILEAVRGAVNDADNMVISMTYYNVGETVHVLPDETTMHRFLWLGIV